MSFAISSNASVILIFDKALVSKNFIPSFFANSSPYYVLTYLYFSKSHLFAINAITTLFSFFD